MNFDKRDPRALEADSDNFKALNSKRTQVVHINKVSSDMGKILYGVPQGSIIGPLLFIVFINDLVFEVKYSRLYMYADDSNLACYDLNQSIICAR